jgi:hypothetical protein
MFGSKDTRSNTELADDIGKANDILSTHATLSAKGDTSLAEPALYARTVSADAQAELSRR